MKIIFVNRYFYPDHSATSQILSDLVFSLARQGINVQVVTSCQIYDDPLVKLPAFETIQGVKVCRILTTRFGRRILLGRIIDYLTFYFSCAWSLLRLVSRGDVIVAKTDPPLISNVVQVIAGIRGAMFVNWLQDLFPDFAIALKARGLNGLLGNILKRLRIISLRSAYVNVVIGRQMSQRLKLLGINTEKIRTIHNWADGELITPLASKKNRLRREWGLNAKFVAGFSGNLGYGREFDTILTAADILRNQKSIVFLIIGAGMQLERLKKEVVRRRLPNFLFKPYQPRKRLRETLACPDVHFVSLLPELEGLVVPSKFYGIAAAGRPAIFIGNPGGEIGEIIADAECGFNVKVGDSLQLVACLRNLASSSDFCQQKGENSRNIFDRRFNQSIATGQWKDLLYEITNVSCCG